MNKDQVIHELKDSITEMMESARAAKGEPFGDVVAGLFELLQVSSTIGGMSEMAARGGVDLTRLASSCALALTTTSIRMCSILNQSDAAEAQQMAFVMLNKRNAAARMVFGAGGTA